MAERRETVRLPEDRVLRLLEEGELEVLGLLPYASNATLLARVRHEELEALAVYKPRRGETPLWDFRSGTLCLREYATWLVDRRLGWSLVPPTVLREGPAGYGAVQLFVDEDPQTDVRDLVRTHPGDLRRLAVLDVVINNADRKAGHLIVDRTGKLWGVDHGVTFNAEHKLRTVVWTFEGEPIPEALLDDLQTFEAGDEFEGLLDPDEREALGRRVAALTSSGRFPAPGPGRSVPWPPW